MTPLPSDIKEEIYLGEFDSREELEAEVEFWDATTAGRYSWCPRMAYYSQEMGLVPKGEALQLDAGNAIHAAMHTLYVSDEPDLALEALRAAFGDRPAPPPSSKYGHIHLGFLEVVFKNYLDWRLKRDTFEPLVVHLDDLDLSRVVAAVWQVLPDGRVILGESKLVMWFDVDGEEFIYAGKPDLPILTGNLIYILDHKTSCGGYLSDWYFEKHIISNQLRGYCGMMGLLLKPLLKKLKRRDLAGALINGVYAGEKAAQTKTKAGKPSSVTKFARYGPLNFRRDQIEEAIVNQWYWKQIRDINRALAEESPSIQKFGWGQNTGKSCQGCPCQEICTTDLRSRPGVIRKKYEKTERSFLDL